MWGILKFQLVVILLLCMNFRDQLVSGFFQISPSEPTRTHVRVYTLRAVLVLAKRLVRGALAWPYENYPNRGGVSKPAFSA